MFARAEKIRRKIHIQNWTHPYAMRCVEDLSEWIERGKQNQIYFFYSVSEGRHRTVFNKLLADTCDWKSGRGRQKLSTISALSPHIYADKMDFHGKHRLSFSNKYMTHISCIICAIILTSCLVIQPIKCCHILCCHMCHAYELDYFACLTFRQMNWGQHVFV